MKQKARSLAKVSRPLLAGYHPRVRVFEQLDRCLELPIIWVAGPAGCGKTTLVNSYLKERRIRPLWYQMDEGDADPATFFYYMRHAARTIVSSRRKSLPLLTPEYQPGLVHFTMRYFEQLFKGMPHQSVMVLDNYSEVPENSVFHSLIRHGLNEIPQGAHVIIISRTSPPAELVRLEANQQMGIIGWSDLRLQAEETEGIVEMLAPGFLARENLEDIQYISDGWAAGVVLMVRKAVTEGVQPCEICRQAPEILFDYFAREVFEQMDPTTQDFLLKTAYLPSTSIALAEELTGYPDSGRILSELARRNYFVERRFHTNVVYSYHPLFREFLLERSKVILSQDTITRVITEAVSLLEKNGQEDEALGLIRKARCWDTMEQFLMDYAPTLLAQGRHRSLGHLLRGIPLDILNSSPWLLLWMGASLLPFEAVKSMGFFSNAYNAFKEKDDFPGFFLAWSGIANAIAYAYTSRSARADELIRDIDERKDAFNKLPSDEIRTMVAVGMFSLLALQHPDHPHADAWAGLALDLARRTGNTNAMALTLLYLVFYHWESGALSDIGEDIAALQHLSREKNLSELAQLTIKLGEAQFYDIATMHAQCLKAVESGLEVACISGIHMWDTFLIGHAAMSCLNVGDSKGAAHYIGMLAPHGDDPRPWVRVNMLFVKTRHALICGNIEEASSYAEQGLELETEDGAPAAFCMHRVLYAHVMHRAGKSLLAGELLSQAKSVAARIGSERFAVLTRFLDAQMAFDEAREDLGYGHLRAALPLAREWGSLGSLWDVPASTAHLCGRALEAGIEVDFVQEIIRRRNLLPDETHLNLQTWPWPVKVYTLGRFQIERGGDPLLFSRKAQKRPLDALKSLIARGGSQVAESLVADLLWPDADGDLALQSLATTLHRLRRMLGSHEAILVANGMITLNPRCCWVDAVAFERIMHKAERLWEKGLSDESLAESACRLTCNALDLYRGRFLPGEEWNPDVITMQENLGSRFFGAISRMGGHLIKCRQWNKALHLFEQGLAVDDCSETCYQGAMTCLDRQGRKAEAVAMFERCRKTLDAKLGIRPMPETESLVRSLRSGHS